MDNSFICDLLQNICLKVVDIGRNTSIFTGCTTFAEIQEIYPIFRRQKCDMTQVPCWGRTSIQRKREKFSRRGVTCRREFVTPEYLCEPSKSLTSPRQSSYRLSRHTQCEYIRRIINDHFFPSTFHLVIQKRLTIKIFNAPYFENVIN